MNGGEEGTLPLIGLDALQIPLAGRIALGGCVLALVVLALWYFLMARKKREKDE